MRNLRGMFVPWFGVVSLAELSFYDHAVSRASIRKRQAETWEEWSESVAELRRCKRRRLAWIRSKEVAWWDAKAQQAQDKADQGDAFGVFATFKELRLHGPWFFFVIGGG